MQNSKFQKKSLSTLSDRISRKVVYVMSGTVSLIMVTYGTMELSLR